jgi:hypothetical protein
MNTDFDELQSISKTIQLYIDGVHNGEVEMLKKAFHPKAMMYGANPGGNNIVDIDGLYGFVSSNEPVVKTSKNHRCIVTSIRYHGNAGVVEMEEVDAYGHDYVNYFQLLKIDGSWVIVSKSYNATAR